MKRDIAVVRIYSNLPSNTQIKLTGDDVAGLKEFAALRSRA